MRVKSVKLFVRVLVFGLLFGASSSAYADALSITSFGFSNLQFTAASGTALFTVTGASARADAGILGGTQLSNVSNSFPIAQASAIVNGITASATANATTNSVSGTSTAFLGGCSCQGGSFAFATLTGTVVLSGAQGPVDVSISALRTILWQVQTDEFGRYAESGTFMDVLVNGSVVFSLQVEALHPLLGPNQSAMLQAAQQISRTVTLQGGSENSVVVRLSATSLVINEVPEPASAVLLVSGLGLMAGVLKQRRRPARE
jgi:hypothetical protein